MSIYMLFMFFIVNSISYALSYYALHRLVYLGRAVVTPAYDVSSSWGTWLTDPRMMVLSVSLILSYFLVGKILSAKWMRWLGWLSGLWMGYITLILFYGGPLHFLELSLLYLLGSRLGADSGAVTELISWVSLISIHLGLLIGVFGASRKPKLARVRVQHEGITEAFSGFRILQLSDVHIGPTIGSGFIKTLSKLCDEAQADLIVMTGDLVDGEVRFLGEEVKTFLKLGNQARKGMVLITGNHEYISGAGPWVRFIQAEGGRVLENEHFIIEEADQRLAIIGVEDWDASRFDPQRRSSLSEALEGVPEDAFKLLLAHQPKSAPEAAQLGVDLQLSGHTHAGQIFPFNYLIYLDQPYNVGRYQLERMILYVSPGTGYWGPPLRLGTRAEATLITLQSIASPTNDDRQHL